MKEVVRVYWTGHLMRDIMSHILSLKYLCTNSLAAGQLHPLWSSVKHPHELRQAAVKANVVTGTYWPQLDEARRKGARSAMFHLCQKSEEDLPHIVLHCSAYADIRSRYLTEFQGLFMQHNNEAEWLAHCADEERLMKLLLDPVLYSRPDPRARQPEHVL